MTTSLKPTTLYLDNLAGRIAQNLAGSITTPALLYNFNTLRVGRGTAGTLAASVNIVTNGAASLGAGTLTFKDSASVSLTGTVKAGDILTRVNDPIQYTCTALATAAGNAITVSITPVLAVPTAGTEAWTIGFGGLPSDGTSNIRSAITMTSGNDYQIASAVVIGDQVQYTGTWAAGAFNGDLITEVALCTSDLAHCGGRGAIAVPVLVTNLAPLSVVVNMNINYSTVV